MKMVRILSVVATLTFLASELPIGATEASAISLTRNTSSKPISISLPATLKDCDANQASNGGRAYTNLWSVRLVVIDVASERIFTNSLGYSAHNPKLSIGADHSFHDLIGAVFRLDRTFVLRRVTSLLALAPSHLALGHGETVLADHMSIPQGHSLVLYTSIHFDVSQGFFSNATKGCNLAGTFSPWVTTAVIASPPTYRATVVATSSLVNGKYGAPNAMPLLELMGVVAATNGSNTGPLPAGFGFPKVQGELLRNDAVITLTRGGRGSVFAGWAKDELPPSNRRDPFTDLVFRAGNW